MSKNKSANLPKNSKQVAQVAEPDVKITEDTTCIVNFRLLGSFSLRQSNAGKKEEIQKILKSPFLEENKKGRFICSGYGAPGRKLKDDEALPKNFYKSDKEYKPFSYHECSQRRAYSSEALQFLCSDEGRPYSIKKSVWDSLSKKEKLQAQFAIDAAELNPICPGFSFEFVN